MDIETIARTYIWPVYLKATNLKDSFDESSWKSTPLIGPGSRIDSLRFVQFLLEIEQSLSLEQKLSRNLTTPDPFRTIGSLALHIQKNLEV